MGAMLLARTPILIEGSGGEVFGDDLLTTRKSVAATHALCSVTPIRSSDLPNHMREFLLRVDVSQLELVF